MSPPDTKPKPGLEMLNTVLIPGFAVAGLIIAVLASRGPGSLRMKLTTLALRLGGKSLARPDVFRGAVLSRTYPEAAPSPKGFAKKYFVQESQLEGRRVLAVSPRALNSKWRIIYTHGGAYVNPLTKPHWDIIAALIDATGATVTVPLYPLAPEFNNRAAYPFLTAVYRKLLATTPSSAIVLVGDSAGAGLALGQAIVFREQALPMPRRIILFSPWLDLTLANPTARELEPLDPILSVDALRLCGQWWAAGDDPTLPHLSPLHAKLAGLPPIDLFQGSHDIFVVDARQFADRSRSQDQSVRYFEYPGAIHVFVGATFTPEAKDVFGKIAACLPRE